MKFCAALITGGRSSRMGADKAFLDWHGVPLWEAQLEKLIALGPETVFVAGRGEQALAARVAEIARLHPGVELRCISDPPDENCGPMGAIARCLLAARAPLLVLAVDLPLMTAEFLRARVLERGVFLRGASGCECMAGLYAPEMLPALEAAMASGDFALHRVIEAAERAGLCGMESVSDADEVFFMNVNTPEDVKTVLRIEKQRARA